MYLSDAGIKRALAMDLLRIEPFIEKNLQPVSIDLTLGNTFLYGADKHHRYYTNSPVTWIRHLPLATGGGGSQRGGLLVSSIPSSTSIGPECWRSVTRL